MTGEEHRRLGLPNDSLLVFPETGLIRLHCPIKAKAIQNIYPIKSGAFVNIMGVSCTKEEPLLYLIDGRFYPHRYFKILTY
ncbi:MAG: hypothetical protein WD511_00680 [Balneolaceae bacterium]